METEREGAVGKGSLEEIAMGCEGMRLYLDDSGIIWMCCPRIHSRRAEPCVFSQPLHTVQPSR